MTFANFVEFDSLYGHRRDVSGYARALEWFDAQRGRVPGAPARPAISPSSPPTMATTRHGAAPTTPANGCRCGGWGGRRREMGLVAFADVAASIAAHLGVPSHGPGRSFL